MTTTVNDISDIVRILRERPDWLETVRHIIVGEELLSLPDAVARFVEATNENFRLVHERLGSLEAGQAETNRRLGSLEAGQAETNRRLDSLEAGQADLCAGQAELRAGQAELRAGQAELRTEQAELRTGQAETNRRLGSLERRFNRMEGRFSNFEGGEYERRARQRILFNTATQLGLSNPVIVMTQDGQSTPELHGGIHRAIRSGRISTEQASDLIEADLIIADDDGNHVLVESSITAADRDVERAGRRAGALATALETAVVPVVATARIAEPQRAFAEQQGVSIFIVNYRRANPAEDEDEDTVETS